LLNISSLLCFYLVLSKNLTNYINEEINMEKISEETFSSYADFIKAVNSARLKFKGKWFTFSGVVDGKSVKLKAYGLWLQVFDVNSIRHGKSVEASTVREFKQMLSDALEY
jgi:hypothetical protein